MFDRGAPVRGAMDEKLHIRKSANEPHDSFREIAWLDEVEGISVRIICGHGSIEMRVLMCVTFES